MRLIIRPRQVGKTYALAQWVKEGTKTSSWPYWDRVIVTVNENEARRIRQQYDLDYHQVFGVTDWTTRHRHYPEPQIAIDNADLILQSFIGSFDVLTMTGDPDDDH